MTLLILSMVPHVNDWSELVRVLVFQTNRRRGNDAGLSYGRRENQCLVRIIGSGLRFIWC